MKDIRDHKLFKTEMEQAGQQQPHSSVQSESNEQRFAPVLKVTPSFPSATEPILSTTFVPKTKLPNIDTSKVTFTILNSIDSCEPCNNVPPTNSVYKTVHSFLSSLPVKNNALVPEGYEFDTAVGRGIRKLEWDASAGRHVFKPYLEKIMVITTIFSGEFGKADEKLELSFFEPFDNSNRTFIVSREMLAKEGTITVVNNYGYAISMQRGDSEAKKLMRYLREYEQVNYFTIDRQVISHKVGFDDKMEEFALYSSKVTIIPEGAEQKRFLDVGYISKGTDLLTYIEGVKEIVKDYSIPIFSYALSFASVLLKVLDAPSFSFELCRNSGFGKTVLQKLALGVWGNPEVLIQPWKATTVGAEGLFDFVDGIITCMEDAHANEDVEVLTNVFYMIFNGRGKLRGAKKGGNRLTTSSEGILFSSTETESSSRINYDGIRRRMIEILDKPFPTKDEAMVAGKLVQELHDSSFGLAGKRWVELIIENREYWEHLKLCYRNTVDELNKDTAKFGFNGLDRE